MAGFATSISCMDGRIQLPLNAWIRENCGVEYVDTITEPGVDKRAAKDDGMAQVRAKAEISINAHGSQLIAVSGHHDCAANPTTDDEHIAQVRKAVAVVESWGLGARVIGLWVDGSWKVHTV